MNITVRRGGFQTRPPRARRGEPPRPCGVVSRRRAPSLRSTGKPAIRRTLQVRSNPVPGA
ncbi:MAG: hypothetical protein LBM98_09880 [Oscillospiraceae bacterium]|nr:hypothetical protein [Oscillospiraceae bacterium]